MVRDFWAGAFHRYVLASDKGISKDFPSESDTLLAALSIEVESFFKFKDTLTGMHNLIDRGIAICSSHIYVIKM